jgi:hypothetical protein
MPIDINQRRLARRFMHQMRIVNLLENVLGHYFHSIFLCHSDFPQSRQAAKAAKEELLTLLLRPFAPLHEIIH